MKKNILHSHHLAKDRREETMLAGFRMIPKIHLLSLFFTTISPKRIDVKVDFSNRLCEINLLEVLQRESLHLDHLIVTGSVVEGVAPLWEVVQHIARVQDGHQAAVHPGYPEQVVCKLDENLCLSIITSWWYMHTTFFWHFNYNIQMRHRFLLNLSYLLSDIRTKSFRVIRQHASDSKLLSVHRTHDRLRV